MGRKFTPTAEERSQFIDRKNELIRQGRNYLTELKEKIADPAFPEIRKEFLARLAGFHRYSKMNRMLIASQHGFASFVQGKTNWWKLGRKIRTGCHDKKIWILRPVIVNKETQSAQYDENEGATGGGKVVGYRMAFVYDVGDTEPIEGKIDRFAQILQMKETGNPAPGLYAALVEFAESIKYRVSQVEEVGGLCEGYCTSTDIVLKKNSNQAALIRVFCHEIGHALLHYEHLKQGRKLDHSPRSVKELEAESVAYVCARTWGIEDHGKALEYIACWSGTVEQITESFNRIHSAASQILTFVEERLLLEEGMKPVIPRMKGLWETLAA